MNSLLFSINGLATSKVIPRQDMPSELDSLQSRRHIFRGDDRLISITQSSTLPYLIQIYGIHTNITIRYQN